MWTFLGAVVQVNSHHTVLGSFLSESSHFCQHCQFSIPVEFHERSNHCHHSQLGYHPARQFSIKDCRWLACMGRLCSIRHATCKNGGEVRLENYTVDGYDENTQCMNSMDAIDMAVPPVIQIEPQTFILTTQTGLTPRFTSRPAAENKS